MRGARGIEFGVDLPALPAIGLGGPNTQTSSSSSGDGWGIKDWGRFVGAWRKEEKEIQREAAKSLDTNRNETDQQRQKEADDAILKSSTDKLSAVFDWLVEQVPAPARLGPITMKSKVVEDAQKGIRSDAEKRGKKDGTQQERKRKNELATKLDLERFYIALSRKMYDEGL